MDFDAVFAEERRSCRCESAKTVVVAMMYCNMGGGKRADVVYSVLC